jgi:hypothetical protein
VNQTYTLKSQISDLTEEIAQAQDDIEKYKLFNLTLIASDN